MPMRVRLPASGRSPLPPGIPRRCRLPGMTCHSSAIPRLAQVHSFQSSGEECVPERRAVSWEKPVCHSSPVEPSASEGEEAWPASGPHRRLAAAGCFPTAAAPAFSSSGSRGNVASSASSVPVRVPRAPALRERIPRRRKPAPGASVVQAEAAGAAREALPGEAAVQHGLAEAGRERGTTAAERGEEFPEATAGRGVPRLAGRTGVPKAPAEVPWP